MNKTKKKSIGILITISLYICTYIFAFNDIKTEIMSDLSAEDIQFIDQESNFDSDIKYDGDTTLFLGNEIILFPSVISIESKTNSRVNYAEFRTYYFWFFGINIELYSRHITQTIKHKH